MTASSPQGCFIREASSELKYNFFLVAGFGPTIQAANATALGNYYNTTELKCWFFYLII